MTLTLKPLKIGGEATPAPEPVGELPKERHAITHLSYTQLSMYLRCSMQYYFRYVLGLQERPKVSLSIGKGGHEALEWNTNSKIKTGVDRPAEEVVQKASDLMDHHMSDMPESEYEKDVEPGAIKDKQLAATRIYMLRDAPAILPVGAEVGYSLDINKYAPESLRDRLTAPIRPVTLKIDILYKDRETRFVETPDRVGIVVEDYKYVTRKKTQAEANISPQLTTYIGGMYDVTGKWPTRAGFRQLHPGSMAKKPKPDDPAPDAIPLMREPEHMTPEALSRRLVRLSYQFARAEEGIRAGNFMPVDDPQTCSWCGFRDRCQASLVDDFEAAQIRAVTTDPAG